jgi:hypothetical protein
MKPIPDKTPWSETPFIELPIYVANCPGYGAIEHQITRTDTNGDGSSTRKATCRACGRRFRIVVSVESLPAAGKWTV